MLPVVIEELQTDLCVYGRCTYAIVDNEDEFSINRLPPDWVVHNVEIY
jgi:hypothetical protein